MKKYILLIGRQKEMDLNLITNKIPLKKKNN